MLIERVPVYQFRRRLKENLEQKEKVLIIEKRGEPVAIIVPLEVARKEMGHLLRKVVEAEKKLIEEKYGIGGEK